MSKIEKLDFKALAVRALRIHRFCGDCFPENGWPEVTDALVQYELEKRKHNKPINSDAKKHGAGYR